jgi:hypothetical protein
MAKDAEPFAPEPEPHRSILYMAVVDKSEDMKKRSGLSSGLGRRRGAIPFP